MTFGAIDIPARGVEDLRKVLSGLEVKLADAKAQRDRILIDMRKASAAADKGDQRARFAQGGLNKEDAAAGRLILSLEAQVAEARKRLGMAEYAGGNGRGDAGECGRGNCPERQALRGCNPGRSQGPPSS